MQKRTLGRSGLEVSALGFGSMGISFSYGPRSAVKTASRSSARRLTAASRSSTPRTCTARSRTKKSSAKPSRPFGIRLSSRRSFGFKFENGKQAGLDSRPSHIRDVADTSLKRLRTDRIDLFYQHRVDPDVPIEDVAGAVKDLIREGKVKHFGMSGAGVQTIRRAHAVEPVAALQSEYSLVVNIRPLKNQQGEIAGAINCFYDITERKQIEETLRDADRRKNEFLAMLAHELRNPLAPILVSIEILRRAKGLEESDLESSQRRSDGLATSHDLSDRIDHALDVLQRQVGQMVRLVDDLLDAGRISRGKIDLRRERVEL
jgi:signal transduction histidine kinase